MKFSLWLIVLALAAAGAVHADKLGKEREAKQAEFDAACEVARQKTLNLVRAQYIAECVEMKQRPNRESCERFYAGYGDRSPNQAPLFYDLPECEKAYEYRTSYRNPGN